MISFRQEKTIKVRGSNKSAKKYSIDTSIVLKSLIQLPENKSSFQPSLFYNTIDSFTTNAVCFNQTLANKPLVLSRKLFSERPAALEYL